MEPAAKAHLHDHLRWVREAFVWKLDGLSEYDVRRPLTATGTTIQDLDLDTMGHVPWWGEDVPLFNVMIHCLSDRVR